MSELSFNRLCFYSSFVSLNLNNPGYGSIVLWVLGLIPLDLPPTAPQEMQNKQNFP